MPMVVPPAKLHLASPHCDQSASHHTLHITRSNGEQEREVCCEVLFAFNTLRYLRAEGRLLVRLISHAGVSSWLAGVLCLLQAEREKKKSSVTCTNKTQPLLISN